MYTCIHVLHVCVCVPLYHTHVYYRYFYIYTVYTQVLVVTSVYTYMCTTYDNCLLAAPWLILFALGRRFHCFILSVVCTHTLYYLYCTHMFPKYHIVEWHPSLATYSVYCN